MPFKSSAQMRAAFGGYLGPEMKAKADTWAHETPSIKSLPAHVGDKHSSVRHALKKRIKPHAPGGDRARDKSEDPYTPGVDE